MTSFRFLFLGLAVLSAAALDLAAKEKVPDWATEVIARPAAVLKKDIHAHVLLDDGLLEVQPNGLFVMRTRGIVRILANEGKKHAVAVRHYDADFEKVRSLRAWLVRPNGDVVAYGKQKIIDAAIFRQALELYGQNRAQIISASEEATPGSVFLWESVVEETSIFTQQHWAFQAELPVERSTFAVKVPPNWKALGRVFNHAPFEPQSLNGMLVWSLGPMEGWVQETMSAPPATRTPLLAVDIIPPSGAVNVHRQAFQSWTDIGAYFSPKYDAAEQCDETMKTKLRALLATETSRAGRILALCRHVQRVNYISIVLNSGNAGGMIPRAAANVFKCNYGDCKDKSNLLRALLREEGVVAYPVMVHTGLGHTIWEEWPSPYQFNHCILAIEVDASVTGPAVVDTPDFGRLMFFDPTDDDTPPGLISTAEAGNRGLILAGAKTALITLPAIAPEQNRVERRVAATLDGAGDMVGSLHEHFIGNASAEVRNEYRGKSATEYHSHIQRWLARGISAPIARKVEAHDGFQERQFDLDVDFNVASYGKPMRDVLLVFKPVVVARRQAVSFKKERRTQPVLMRAFSFEEDTEIALPAGFDVDDLPPPVELKTTFGAYASKASVVEGKLRFKRTLRLENSVIPPEQYESVRSFFEKTLQAENSPVVLKRI